MTTPTPPSAGATLNPDGTVTLRNCWEDHGQGADIATLTAGHETLRQAGFTPDMIKLEMNDTKLAPNSGPAGGSRSTVMTGSATRVACENLLKAMRKEDGTYRTYDEMVADGIDTKAVGIYTLHRFRGARPGHQPGRSLPELHVHDIPARGRGRHRDRQG